MNMDWGERYASPHKAPGQYDQYSNHYRWHQARERYAAAELG